MNNFVGWISHQEQFLFKEISLSFLYMIALYIVIAFASRFLIDKKPKKLMYLLLSILFLQSVYVFENYQKRTKKEFIVFHANRNSVLGKRVGDKLLVYHHLDSVSIKKVNFLTSYKIGENVDMVFNNTIPAFYEFEKNQILIIDSLGVYQLKV